MDELIPFCFVDDDPAKEGCIQLLDGSGEYAYRMRFGTYLTYNTGSNPIRHFKTVKLPGRRLMAQLIEIIT